MFIRVRCKMEAALGTKMEVCDVRGSESEYFKQDNENDDDSAIAL